ncbi:nuclear transport factor 2 family protein [Nocardia sp. NPDC056100]|uniref:nuclear transport factor 2 family protein n=1 Tax=Nocardia sp. NPDC056100 TaxID=3345712 RepID=UPI0035DA9541
MTTVHTLDIETRFALRDLVDRYARAIDSRLSPELEVLFDADAVILLPELIARRTGNRELRDFATIVPNLTSMFEATRHLMFQQTLTVVDGQVHGEVYSEAHHLYRTPAGPRDAVMHSRYLDVYVEQEGSWRFAQREQVLDWIDDRSISESSPVG